MQRDARRVIGLLIPFCAAIACAGNDGRGIADETPAWPGGAPYITGVVTEASATSLRVEERPKQKGGSPKAVVTLSDETILRRADGKPARRDEVRVGDRVAVWVTGPVMESYPVRAAASAVRIEPAP